MEISHLPRKHNIYKRNTKHLEKVNFIAEIVNINWPTILSIEKKHPNYSFDVFDLTINKIMDNIFHGQRLQKKSLSSNLTHG